MFTVNGNIYEVGKGTAPTLREIATGLARTRRFAGATLIPWSVAQHSLAAYQAAYDDDCSPQELMAVLAHDFEEFACGDTPTRFKTDEQRELGHEVRRDLFKRTLCLPYSVFTQNEKMVKHYDRELLNAEAHCYLHPFGRRHFLEPESHAVVNAVWNLAHLPEHEQVGQLIDAVEQTRAIPRLAALRGRA